MLKEISFLQEICTFWKHLTQVQRDLLLHSAVEVKYEAQKQLHHSGAACIGVLLVKTGGIRVYILSKGGNTKQASDLKNKNMRGRYEFFI